MHHIRWNARHFNWAHGGPAQRWLSTDHNKVGSAWDDGTQAACVRRTRCQKKREEHASPRACTDVIWGTWENRITKEVGKTPRVGMNGLFSAELDAFLYKNDQMLINVKGTTMCNRRRRPYTRTPNHVPPLKHILACVELPPNPNHTSIRLSQPLPHIQHKASIHHPYISHYSTTWNVFHAAGVLPHLRLMW